MPAVPVAPTALPVGRGLQATLSQRGAARSIHTHGEDSETHGQPTMLALFLLQAPRLYIMFKLWTLSWAVKELLVVSSQEQWWCSKHPHTTCTAKALPRHAQNQFSVNIFNQCTWATGSLQKIIGSLHHFLPEKPFQILQSDHFLALPRLELNHAL